MTAETAEERQRRLKRTAMHLVNQLPDDPAEAVDVVLFMRELLTTFLGLKLPAYNPPDDGSTDGAGGDGGSDPTTDGQIMSNVTPLRRGAVIVGSALGVFSLSFGYALSQGLV